MRSPVSVVAVIPARAGSVGVPGKNLRRVGGLPLVTRAVRTALATASVDRVVVSTDGLEIASVAAETGADVVMRPAALSTGSASSESAVVHALDVLRERGVRPSVVVLMQATSPFTTPAELDAAVRRVRSGESDSVFAAVPSHGFLWRLDAAGGASGVNHDASIRPMRQDLPPQFRETGAFYVLDAAGFARSGHRFFGRVGVAIVHDEIDIDTERDLEIADAVEHLHRDSDHPQWDTVQYAEAALGEKTAALSASGTHIPSAASETARAVVAVDGSSAPRHAQTFWDARDIADELQLDPRRTRRIRFNEITKSAIQQALAHPEQINAERVAAQEARRAMDRVVGFPLSNLLGKKVAGGLSAGRVQSVAVKLIVDREREIEAFVTEEYWKVTAMLAPAGSGVVWVSDPKKAKIFAKKKPGEDKAEANPDREGGGANEADEPVEDTEAPEPEAEGATPEAAAPLTP